MTSICFRGLSSSFQMFLAFDWALLKRLFVWDIFDGFGGWHILQQSEFSSIFDSIRKIEPAGAAEGLRQWVSHRKPKGIVKSACVVHVSRSSKNARIASKPTILRNIQWHREEEKSDNDFITASWKLHFFIPTMGTLAMPAWQYSSTIATVVAGAG